MMSSTDYNSLNYPCDGMQLIYSTVVLDDKSMYKFGFSQIYDSYDREHVTEVVFHLAVESVTICYTTPGNRYVEVISADKINVRVCDSYPAGPYTKSTYTYQMGENSDEWTAIMTIRWAND
jgi:hypothetical protein